MSDTSCVTADVYGERCGERRRDAAASSPESRASSEPGIPASTRRRRSRESTQRSEGDKEKKSELGNVSVLVAAAVVLCGLLCVGFARLESAATAKARAETAADAAALAAASALGDGESPAVAVQVAESTAAENGARLVTCRCRGTDATVTVAVDAAQARARATVSNPPFG